MKLTEAQLATLREMASYKLTPYWFRQATCKSLVAMGLAAPSGPQERKRRPHVITPAGRAALGAEEKE